MKQKNRNGFVAGLLSLFIPGLGHIYAGSLKKGSLLLFIELFVLVFLALLGLLSTFKGLVLYFSFIIIFRIYAIISSVRLSKKNNPYTLKPYNRWYWYIIVVVVISLISPIIEQYKTSVLGFNIYRISAASMSPTLQVGDLITTDTKYSSLKIGDVFVFWNPQSPQVPYVKRVAALSGDTISIKSGNVIVNGSIRKELDVPDNIREKDYSQSMNEIKVPSGEVFFLGDFRDNSNDSRFWGNVKKSEIIGKVTYIFFSKSLDRIGLKVK